MEADPDDADAFAQLEALLAHAPARQVGQPGNDLVDTFIRQLFERSVARNNDPKRRAEAVALERAEQAEAVLTRSLYDKQLAATRRTDALVSPWYIQLTLESPSLLVLTLAMLAVMFWAGFAVQRRRVLLVAGSVCVGAAIVALMAAALIDTEVERTAVQSEGGAGGETGGQIRTQQQVVEAANEAARAALRADLEAAEVLRGLWQCGRVRYPSVAFIPGQAVLTTQADPRARLRLYQVAPNLSEPGNLPETGFSGRLVYVGSARPNELAGQDLRDAVVLMYFNSDRRWVQAVERGASVVILIEPPTSATLAQAAQKITDAPLSIPRFYVRSEDLVKAWGHDWSDAISTGIEVRIRQPEPGRWQHRDLFADWLFIPGTAEPRPDEPPERDTARQLVHIQTYKDSHSVVPELSPGATSAANLVATSRLLQHFERQPPRRPVLISVVNDHTNALTGEQEFFFSAFASTRAIDEELNNIDLQLAQQTFIREVYDRKPTHKLIEQMRVWNEVIGGQMLEIKSPAIDLLTDRRNTINGTRSRLGMELVKLKQELADSQRKRPLRPDQSLLPLEESFDLTAEPLDLREGDGPSEPKSKDGSSSAEAASARLQSSAIKPTGSERKGALFLEVNRLQKKLDEIDLELADTNVLMQLFNRLGWKTEMAELNDRQLNRLSGLFDTLHRETSAQILQYQADRDRLVENLKLRRRLLVVQAKEPSSARSQKPAMRDETEVLERRYAPLPAILALTLDLSFATDRLGLFHTGFLNENDTFNQNAQRRVRRLALHTLNTAQRYEQTTGRPNLLEDTIRGARGVSWQAHLGGRFALGARVAHQYAVPALTLTSLHDMRSRTFTPHDTIDRIDQDNFARVMEFVEGYVPALIDSEGLEQTRMRRGEPQTMAIRMTVRLQDPFSLGMPRRTLADAIVTALPNVTQLPHHFRMLGQVRPWVVRMTDTVGRTTIRGSDWSGSGFQVFAYDDAFRRIRAVLDFNEGERRAASYISSGRNSEFITRELITFEAMKVDLMGLTEPLTLSQAQLLQVIDARQDAMPLHFATSGIRAFGSGKAVAQTLDGTGCVFIEPDVPFKLRIGNGLVLNADRDHPSGRGFDPTVGILRNLAWISAHDLWRLSDTRLGMLRDKGVTNETARLYSDASGKRLAAVEQANAGSHRHEVLTGAEEARGTAFRAYSLSLGTINDLIRAVVIFMALVIPFCFFIMKLITPFTDTTRQMVSFVVVFLAMVSLLQIVHPAFEVADLPQVAILGFVILGLAVFVATMIIGRFNATMTEAVDAHLGAESDTAQSRLAGVAFLVGVNNMKRRRIRTTLTCVTVVLVTFTMLSVISVDENQEPVRLRLSREAPYNGFVFTRAGMAPLGEVQATRLRAHFENWAVTVARVWGQRFDKFGAHLPVEVRSVSPVPGAAERALAAKVLLGLEVAEDGFIEPMPLVGGGRWFSSNDAEEVLLTVKGAALLGIMPENFHGRQLLINGRSLELVGLLDDEKFSALRDLSNLPLLPLSTEASSDIAERARVAKRQAAQEATGAAVFDSGVQSLAQGAQIVRGTDVAIVPLNFARTFSDARYRVLSVKYLSGPNGDASAAAQRAWDHANRLVRFQHTRVALGLTASVNRTENPDAAVIGAGQYALASTGGIEVGNLSRMAIPLFLVATIIFNSMLGAVMERKREVGIYNAIGLNPTHVIMFFFAESLVFGLVGSVAGYLIGQCLSLVFARLDLIELNLNYSSLSVLMVIFLAIATVMLSTIYPAVMAARSAVPSGEGHWSMPQPEGDQIQIRFPFSYDPSRVLAVLAYLQEYMNHNSEASSGEFLATMGPLGRVPAVAGQPDEAPNAVPHATYVMLFDIAPAPFDLGVNEQMELYAYFDSRVHAYTLMVYLTRVSGQISDWMTVNQPFLTLLRKRLLYWRSKDPDTQQSYYSRGEEMFRDAPDLPVQPA